MPAGGAAAAAAAAAATATPPDALAAPSPAAAAAPTGDDSIAEEVDEYADDFEDAGAESPAIPATPVAPEAGGDTKQKEAFAVSAGETPGQEEVNKKPEEEAAAAAATQTASAAAEAEVLMFANMSQCLWVRKASTECYLGTSV